MTEYVEIVCIVEEKVPQLHPKAFKGHKYLVDSWYWEARGNFEMIPIFGRRWNFSTEREEICLVTRSKPESFVGIDEWRNLQIDKIL